MDLYLVKSGDRGGDAHYCAPPHRVEEGAVALRLGDSGDSALNPIQPGVSATIRNYGDRNYGDIAIN